VAPAASTGTGTGTGSTNSSITSSTTTFNNGARYVVNADGTVTVLSNVATTTPTTNTTASTGTNSVLSDVLGTSPGQTSTGTAAGNSSAGIVDSGSALASGTVLGTTGTALAPGVVVGGLATTGGVVGNVDYGAMADAGNGVNANGERVASAGGFGNVTTVGVTDTARAPTPTYDMVTRAATAREINRRAKGDTPRVYGIAPRTNNDRTDQMPDDPVIRY
jgi:hypothetical protein